VLNGYNNRINGSGGWGRRKRRMIRVQKVRIFLPNPRRFEAVARMGKGYSTTSNGGPKNKALGAAALEHEQE